MRRTNKNLNVINVIEENGDISEVATYDGKFSALYTLILFYCQLLKLDFFNKLNLEKARKEITIGVSKKTCFFERDGKTYSCVAAEGRLCEDGVNGSTLDYVPSVPLQLTGNYS